MDLQQLVNVPRDDFLLIVGWILMALSGRGPFPILAIQGEQGTGKSTLTRMVRTLVDPSTAPLRGAVRDARDIIVAARNSHVLVADNLSGLTAEISDIFCRIATGGGFAERQLYTNNEEVISDIQRPIILNGIDDVTIRGDLIDRALLVHLSMIPEDQRRDEQSTMHAFKQMHAQLFGGICTALAAYLAKEPYVKLDRLPRMADFARLMAACEMALGLETGTLADCYQRNRLQATQGALEANPFVEGVVRFMASHAEWHGTATDMLPTISRLTPDSIVRSNAWPKTGRTVVNALARAASVLRAHGISFIRGSRQGASGMRIMELRKSAIPSSVSSVASVQP